MFNNVFIFDIDTVDSVSDFVFYRMMTKKC